MYLIALVFTWGSGKLKLFNNSSVIQEIWPKILGIGLFGEVTFPQTVRKVIQYATYDVIVPLVSTIARR